jgi:aminoglycoside phosphotransferase (APT) family kinase protein
LFEDRLASWIRAKLGEASGSQVTDLELGPLERPKAGQSSDMVLFTARWRDGTRQRSADLVLRRQPAPDGIFMTPDAVREFQVLRGLRLYSQAPVPTVRWAEPDPTVLGAPFFVMDRVAGRVPTAKPSIHSNGWLVPLDPTERESLWDSAMATLVAVHATPWRQSHGFLVKDGQEPGLEGHLRTLTEWYRWAVDERSFPVTDAALAYLLDRRAEITEGEPVLVWGDARIGNMIFGADLTVAAALDWEVAGIGPAAIDIAHWLIFDEFATTACGVDRLAGFPGREDTIACYEERSGRVLHDLDYFEIMQAFFLATTLIRQADAKIEAGSLPAGSRMGHGNALTQMLARRLGLPVPELAEDYLRHRRVDAATQPRTGA